MSEATADSAIDSVVSRLDELADLFRRRLLDDKDKRRAFDSLYERLERAERAAEGEAVMPVVRQLLLVVDRLDAYQGEEPLVASVRDEILEVLRRSGIEPIGSMAQFDPSLHEVVEVADMEGTEGSIVRQVRRGFLFGDRVLRPSQVVVVNGVAAPATGGPESSDL